MIPWYLVLAIAFASFAIGFISAPPLHRHEDGQRDREIFEAGRRHGVWQMMTGMKHKPTDRAA